MSRSVVVTGANSGIGLVTVLELAAAGYDVVELGLVRTVLVAPKDHRPSIPPVDP